MAEKMAMVKSESVTRWWPVLPVAHAWLVARCGTFYGSLESAQAWGRDGLLLAGAVTGAWLLFRSASLRRSLGTSLLWWILALLVLVSTMPLHGPYPRFAWPAVLGVSGGMGWGVVALFALRGHESRLWWCARYLAACGLAVSVWSYMEFKAGVTVRPSMPLGHHNFLAGTLLLCLGPALAICFGSDRARDRLLGGVAGVLMVMTLAGTSSLGGFAGLVVGGAFAAWRLGSGDAALRMGRAGPRPWSIAVAVAIGVVVAMTVIPGGPRIASRSTAILTGGSDLSLRNRIDYAHAAIGATWDSAPLVGFGAGATAPQFALHRIQRHEAEETGKIVTQLHSTPVHVFYEGGLVGLFLACGLVFACTGVIRRARVSHGGADTIRGVRLGASASLLAYGIASLADFQLHIAAIGGTLALVFAVAASGGAEDGGPRGQFVGRLLAFAMALSAISATTVLTPVRRAHSAWDRALAAQDAGNRIDAEKHARLALQLDPELGLYQWMLADLLDDAGPLSESEAISLRIDGARRVPAVSLFSAAVGEALLQAGRVRAARPHLQLAAALDAASPLPWFFLGEAARRSGEPGAAVDHHARALRLDSRLIGATVYRDAGFDSLRVDLAATLRLSLRSGARLVDLPPGIRSRRADATLAIDVDANPWRSRSAFVFRRRAWPTEVMAVPVTVAGALGRVERRLSTVESRFPGTLGMPPGPELPSTAMDILVDEGWNSAMEMTGGPR